MGIWCLLSWDGALGFHLAHSGQDNLGAVAASAVVDITLNNDGGQSWTGSATTGADGAVTFTLKNAPGGCYTPGVTDVTATGLVWNDVTNPPYSPNPFCK